MFYRTCSGLWCRECSFEEIVRVSERFHPLGIVIVAESASVGTAVLPGWLFLLVESFYVVDDVHCAFIQYSVGHKNCQRNEDRLYFTTLYQQNASAWIHFIKQLPGLECYRNFKPHLKFFNLAAFLSLVFTLLYPYLPLSLWRLFNNNEVKHHVYVKLYPVTKFLFTCPLLFVISTHTLVVSRNFSLIRTVLSCFICSFSILRNSRLESDVCPVAVYV